jgi:hypothetical protein
MRATITFTILAALISLIAADDATASGRRGRRCGCDDCQPVSSPCCGSNGQVGMPSANGMQGAPHSLMGFRPPYDPTCSCTGGTAPYESCNVNCKGGCCYAYHKAGGNCVCGCAGAPGPGNFVQIKNDPIDANTKLTLWLNNVTFGELDKLFSVSQDPHNWDLTNLGNVVVTCGRAATFNLEGTMSDIKGQLDAFQPVRQARPAK